MHAECRAAVHCVSYTVLQSAFSLSFSALWCTGACSCRTFHSLPKERHRRVVCLRASRASSSPLLETPLTRPMIIFECTCSPPSPAVTSTAARAVLLALLSCMRGIHAFSSAFYVAYMPHIVSRHPCGPGKPAFESLSPDHTCAQLPSTHPIQLQPSSYACSNHG